eukprot:420598_1
MTATFQSLLLILFIIITDAWFVLESGLNDASYWISVMSTGPGNDWPAGSGSHRHIGQTATNDMWRETLTPYFRRECPTCDTTHQQIIYKRITNPQSFDVYTCMREWLSTNNVLGQDFNLYSTLQDAINDTNAWQYCNYDVDTKGAFADCNIPANTAVVDQWTGWYAAGSKPAMFYILKTPRPTPEPTTAPTSAPTGPLGDLVGKTHLENGIAWAKAFVCDEDAQSIVYSEPFNDLNGFINYAQYATSIKFASLSYSTYATECSNPIYNLNNGKELSYRTDESTGKIEFNADTGNWNGSPDLMSNTWQRNNCHGDVNFVSSEYPFDISKSIYWACNNQKGLHILPTTNTVFNAIQCHWNGERKMDVYLGFDASLQIDCYGNPLIITNKSNPYHIFCANDNQCIDPVIACTGGRDCIIQCLPYIYGSGWSALENVSDTSFVLLMIFIGLLLLYIIIVCGVSKNNKRYYYLIIWSLYCCSSVATFVCCGKFVVYVTDYALNNDIMDEHIMYFNIFYFIVAGYLFFYFIHHIGMTFYMIRKYYSNNKFQEYMLRKGGEQNFRITSSVKCTWIMCCILGGVIPTLYICRIKNFEIPISKHFIAIVVSNSKYLNLIVYFVFVVFQLSILSAYAAVALWFYDMAWNFRYFEIDYIWTSAVFCTLFAVVHCIATRWRLGSIKKNHYHSMLEMEITFITNDVDVYCNAFASNYIDYETNMTNTIQSHLKKSKYIAEVIRVNNNKSNGSVNLLVSVDWNDVGNDKTISKVEMETYFEEKFSDIKFATSIKEFIEEENSESMLPNIKIKGECKTEEIFEHQLKIFEGNKKKIVETCEYITKKK